MSKDERPRWRVNEKSHIGHSLVEEGTEVFYTPGPGGEVGDNLSPLNDAAQEIVDEQKSPHPDKTGGKGRPKPVEKPENPDDGSVVRPQGDKRASAPRGAKAKAAPPAAADDGDIG